LFWCARHAQRTARASAPKFVICIFRHRTHIHGNNVRCRLQGDQLRRIFAVSATFWPNLCFYFSTKFYKI
jgi:hypothetical protein